MAKKARPAIGIAACCVAAVASAVEPPRALPPGTLPRDSRLQPLKDLDGYFPFTPPITQGEWETRAANVRRHITVALGLWPMPTKTPLKAVVHGKIDRGDYSVENVYFESAPGFFVTGNLYRPANVRGNAPAVMFAHGHWEHARLSLESPERLRREIASGAERFELGGRSRFQSMCVQLARMGCIVWHWDMLGDSDSVQLSRELIHGFARQRPEMNNPELWGFFSPQAEARLQSPMGLQTWNSIRSLDFLLTLPEVDPERIAITGASGGGTQTMILSAIDPRIALSFPAVMVSTAMQGGCTCENACLLRVETGNVEFAALFAPKPQGLTTADDWTKAFAAQGFPDLERLYQLVGAPQNITLHRGEHFPHNYNAVSRSAFYGCLNRHFRLGFEEPIIERDFEPLNREQLTVWKDEHGAPAAGDADFERSLLQWFQVDAQRQLQAAAASRLQWRKIAGGAVEAIIGRTGQTPGEIEWTPTSATDHPAYVERCGLVRNSTYDEVLPVVWLHPRQARGRVVVWLSGRGKESLFQPDGSLPPFVKSLLADGADVIGADLLEQGEFRADGQQLEQVRVVDNPREFAGYTFGYNRPLFVQRTHDVLTLVAFARGTESDRPRASTVAVVGVDDAGPIVAAARAVAGNAIDRAAIETAGFRFGGLVDYRHPQFLPGGAKYLDIPGILALSAPHPLLLSGETETALVRDAYRRSEASAAITLFEGKDSEFENAAAKWSLED